MARQIKLAAQVRPEVGRTAVNKIKSAGFVPAVVYGAKQQPLHLSVSAREISNVLSHATGEHLVVELEIAENGATSNKLAIIQEVQHDPIRGDVLHVDFHAVSADEKIHAQIPVETFGDAAGVKNYGGLLEAPMHSLEVECLPKDLPEVIRIDVSALNVGDAIHVREVQLPSGVTAKADGNLVVVRVAAPNVSDPSAAVAASVAGPEVIKEKKAEEAK